MGYCQFLVRYSSKVNSKYEIIMSETMYSTITLDLLCIEVGEIYVVTQKFTHKFLVCKCDVLIRISHRSIHAAKCENPKVMKYMVIIF